MTAIYLSQPALTADWLMPRLATFLHPSDRVAVMAQTQADCKALTRALDAFGITPIPLVSTDKPAAYDVVIAFGAAARALAGLNAADFHIEVNYIRTDDGDMRMQTIAQTLNQPVYALGEAGALIVDEAGELHFFGDINAYHPIMLLSDAPVIRAVTTDDLDACVALIRDSFSTVADEFGFTPDNAPRFTAFATTHERLAWQLHEGRPMFCAEADGRIVGYYSLHMQADGVCELNNLCVTPECRHRKLGETLLHHAFAEAAARGQRVMTIGIVEENRRLRRWYERFGFTHTGTQKFDFFPFTCGYMRKVLN